MTKKYLCGVVSAAVPDDESYIGFRVTEKKGINGDVGGCV